MPERPTIGGEYASFRYVPPKVISPDKNIKIEHASREAKINEMLKNPEGFYVPPTDEYLRSIEPNRRKREKIKKYFRESINSLILTTAISGHEQILEIDEAREKGIDLKKYQQLRSYLLANKTPEEIEKDLGITEQQIEDIIEHVESQPILIKHSLNLLNRQRQTLLDQAVAKVQTEEKQLNDSLTGEFDGLSKPGVEIKYKDAIEETDFTQENLVFVNFDLNSFKLINDQKGHATGDLVLKDVVKALTGRLKDILGLRSDDIVGRTGGDEFTVIGRVKKGIEQEFLDRLNKSVQSVKNPLGGNISITGGAYLVTDSKVPFEQANTLSDETGIFQKIKSGEGILIYTPDLKPDLTTKEKRHEWAEAWVFRKAKREREKIIADLNKETDQKSRLKIIRELKLFEDTIGKEIQRKESELERQVETEQKKRKGTNTSQ